MIDIRDILNKYFEQPYEPQILIMSPKTWKEIKEYATEQELDHLKFAKQAIRTNLSVSGTNLETFCDTCNCGKCDK